MFPPPPEWLVWVGSVAGILALLLGAVMLPTVFQMFWGGPSLNTRLEQGVKGKKRWLQVFLENRPIGNKWLKLLRVHRDTIQSLNVSIRLAEVGSGRIIVPIRQVRIYTDDTGDTLGRFRISLPATYSVAANVMVAYWDEDTNAVVVPPNTEDDESRIRLDQGYYRMIMNLIVDGRPKLITRNFRIGTTPDDLMWTP